MSEASKTLELEQRIARVEGTLKDLQALFADQEGRVRILEGDLDYLAAKIRPV